MTVLALFNGLWQGALLTGAAYAVSRMLSPRDAATRYALWMTTLAAIAVIPIATTLFHIPLAFSQYAARSGVASHITISLIAISSQAMHGGMHFAAVVQWLLGLWAAGAFFNLCRLLRGLVQMESIARDAHPSVGNHLASEVFISDDIEVPLVAGIVRPRILIPSEMHRTLDAMDLQRIVAHERAHVDRKDPSFNLLVRTLQAMLFYNPFVHFVARKLADEREAACDDLAIAQSGQRFDYAASLAAVAQMRPRRIEVMSATALGFRTSLLARIERLQSAQPHSTTINRKALGGTVMLFAIIALALQAVTPALALSDTVAQAARQPSASVVAAGCAKPNAEAGVLNPQAPAMPHGLNRTGNAQAIVTIAATGRVTGARILHSSGNSAIDVAVLSAARRSTYSPKVVNCVAVASSYIFRVDFRP